MENSLFRVIRLHFTCPFFELLCTRNCKQKGLGTSATFGLSSYTKIENDMCSRSVMFGCLAVVCQAPILSVDRKGRCLFLGSHTSDPNYIPCWRCLHLMSCASCAYQYLWDLMLCRTANNLWPRPSCQLTCFYTTCQRLAWVLVWTLYFDQS